MAKGVVIGGVASGVGKTTITAGLAAAMRSRGLRVQPFKAGPDYLDPTHLGAFAGRACRNLDTWMLPAAHVRELFARAMHGVNDADVALVEGVMGLHDGRSGTDGAGSSASLARLLRLPVVLVVDASAMARSAAAIVLGYQLLDPELRFAGVILNRVAGAGHASMCTSAIEEATGLPVFGWLPRDAEIALPERHLGLTPTFEGAPDADLEARLIQLVESHIDVGALLARMGEVDTTAPARLFPSTAVAPRVRVAVARDRAFHFYYQDSLDLLEAWGAELVPFSPRADSGLPPRIDAVLLGGGFPELEAEALAANLEMRASIRGAAASGVPIYGECGGLMYLGERLTDFEGRAHEMLGLVPARSVMTTDRLTLGYREVASLGTPFLAAGELVRGHEFHWSTLEGPVDPERAAYRVLGEEPRLEGFCSGPVTASYVHLHLGARADLAPNFVEHVARARQART
ncbi:MAG: cobyrinate a,c-diamide synthase [Dehalococcoidia bacterium]